MKVIMGMAAIVLSIFCVGIAQAEKIRIATEGTNPPFNMKNKKDELTGFEVDIARALCFQMKADCAIITQPRDGIISGLEEKKYDAIIATMAMTEGDSTKVSFSNHYYSNYPRFIAKKESGLTVSLEGLENKKLGAQRATNGARYLQEAYQQSAKVKLYDTSDAAFKDLKSDQLDTVLVDAYVGYNWLIKAESMDYDLVGEAIDVNEQYAIAIRKEDVELQLKLNAALSAILANGTYKRISWNYFPFEVY